MSDSKKRKRHSPEQVIIKLREADVMLAGGKSVGQICQALGVSEATLSRWRNQCGGMKSGDAKKLKKLEQENTRLKRIVADLTLDKAMLKELNAGRLAAGGGWNQHFRLALRSAASTNGKPDASPGSGRPFAACVSRYQRTSGV